MHCVLQPTGLNYDSRGDDWRCCSRERRAAGGMDIADLPAVACDPVLVKQIFQNLLSNALKFTRPRAHAVIEVNHKSKPIRAGGVSSPGQWHRLQHEICRQVIRSLSEVAPRGRFRRHRYRPGDGATHRSKARRPGVGGGENWTRARPFISPSAWESKRNRKVMEQRLEADYERRRTGHTCWRKTVRTMWILPCIHCGGEKLANNISCGARWRGSTGLSLLPRGIHRTDRSISRPSWYCWI